MQRYIETNAGLAAKCQLDIEANKIIVPLAISLDPKDAVSAFNGFNLNAFRHIAKGGLRVRFESISGTIFAEIERMEEDARESFHRDHEPARKPAEPEAPPPVAPAPIGPVIAWDILVQSYDTERRNELIMAISPEFRGAAEDVPAYEANLALDLDMAIEGGANCLLGRVSLERVDEVMATLRSAGACVISRPVHEETPAPAPGPQFFGVVLRAVPAGLDKDATKALEGALKKAMGVPVAKVREELQSLPATIADRKPEAEAKSMATALRALGCEIDLAPWASSEDAAASPGAIWQVVISAVPEHVERHESLVAYVADKAGISRDEAVNLLASPPVLVARVQQEQADQVKSELEARGAIVVIEEYASAELVNEVFGGSDLVNEVERGASHDGPDPAQPALFPTDSPPPSIEEPRARESWEGDTNDHRMAAAG